MEASNHVRAAKQRSGFTLLELLLVVSLLAVVAVIVAPPAGAWLDRMAFKDSAKRLAAALRLARVDAMRQSAIMEISVTPNQSEVLIGRQRLPIQGGGVVSYLGTALNSQTQQGGVIRFYPDGSADRGLVVLKADNAIVQVTIHPVTGRVNLAWH